MKHLLFVIPVVLICLVISNTGLAQQVPNKAKAAFNKKFPNAQNVNWGKENADEFEAEFTLSGPQMSANFDSQGNWKETETAIAQSDLPSAVQHTISGDYKKATVKQSYKVESPGKMVYEVEVSMGEEHGREQDENEQGEYGEKGHVRELVFTKDGKLVKKEGREEDNN